MAKEKAAKSNGSNGKTNGAGTTVPVLHFTGDTDTLDEVRARLAIPVVDEDQVERPSVEVHTAAPTGAPTGTRYLKCELDDDEIMSLRLEREHEDEQIEDLQGEIDRAAEQVKSLKRRIEVLQEAGSAKSKTIRLGYEWRNVPCQERRGADPREDALDGSVGICTYRLDTGDCIEWRELTATERQGTLFQGTGDSTAATAATAS